MTRPHLFPRASAMTHFGVMILVLALIGCQGNHTDPMLNLMPPKASPANDPAALQTRVLRLADDYIDRTVYAIDDYATRVGTADARRQAILWKVNGGSTAVAIASGPNPDANLIDFLALTTITRTSLQEVWINGPNGAAYQPWLDASREVEANAWKLAADELSPAQQQEMRNAIQKWWEANPSVHANLFVRPEEVSAFMQAGGNGPYRPGSVFGLLGLDPTAGLDPAVREVTRSRLFAERAMFVAQRTVFLLRWQIELLTDQLTQDPMLASSIGSVDRLSRAAQSISQTAAELPDRITIERKAVLADLQSQEGKLRDLSAQVSQTLDAGGNMSTSLNTMLITFNALMKRFGVGEPAPPPPPGPPSPPFNILDYAHTADQMGIMAQRLDALIKDAGSTMDSPALDRRIADLEKLTQRAQSEARSTLNHAFVLVAGLILLTFACAIAYRRSGRASRRQLPGGSPRGPTEDAPAARIEA